MLNKIKSSQTNCICCLSNEERLQIEHSRKIDRDLAALKRRFRATQKIVLLGAGESGKSTFLKQMQLIHGEGFDYNAKLSYRTQIYENILKGIAGLINGKRELQLPWKGPIQMTGENSNNMDAGVRMRPILQSFSILYKQLMEDREVEENRLNTKIHIFPQQFSQISQLIIDIWNDDSIREAYDRRREFPKYFVENAPYFIESIQKLSKKDYIPDSSDILRCRKATTGITEIEMEIKSVPFQFIDVGGQRTQRQKWHQCFSDVTAILFLASSSEFDEYLREDGSTNRLEESCKVFETLVNYKYLKNVEFILFLNKHDLLREKIHLVNIKNFCSDFYGNPNSITDVENYLISKFAFCKKRKTPTPMYSLPSQNYQTGNESFLDLNFEKNDEKSIYSHFTTAIDTNNIKTIFEMVRLMIFEKNCKAIMLT